MYRKIALLLLALPTAIAWAGPFTMKVVLPGLKSSQAVAKPPAPAVVKEFQELAFGGLRMVKPVTATTNFAGAVAKCSGTINSETGWRIPSSTEWSTVYNGVGQAAFASAGYDMTSIGWVWHSNIYRTGQHLVSRPLDSLGSIADDVDAWWTVCVKNS